MKMNWEHLNMNELPTVEYSNARKTILRLIIRKKNVIMRIIV